MEYLGDSSKKLQLLYRASEDGRAIIDMPSFHKSCDNKGATITIVESKEGNVFGGYTKIPWTSPSTEKYKSDPSAWIFVVRSNSNRKGKWEVKKPQYAVYHGKNHGPTFGRGPDFEISATARVSNAGHSYKCPKTNKATLIAGDAHFTVKDYEVSSPLVYINSTLLSFEI